MKTFVSEELKGLKQEHRLLSLRECYSILPLTPSHICTAALLKSIFSSRHWCQRVDNEEENKAGLSGAAEDRTL